MSNKIESPLVMKIIVYGTNEPNSHVIARRPNRPTWQSPGTAFIVYHPTGMKTPSKHRSHSSTFIINETFQQEIATGFALAMTA